MNDDLIKRLNRWGADEGLQNHFIGSRSARRDCEEAAAALAEAQATIARLEALLQEAVDTLDDGWGTEQVTKEAAEAYFELMPRLKAELSPREGDG